MYRRLIVTANDIEIQGQKISWGWATKRQQLGGQFLFPKLFRE